MLYLTTLLSYIKNQAQSIFLRQDYANLSKRNLDIQGLINFVTINLKTKDSIRLDILPKSNKSKIKKLTFDKSTTIGDITSIISSLYLNEGSLILVRLKKVNLIYLIRITNNPFHTNAIHLAVKDNRPASTKPAQTKSYFKTPKESKHTHESCGTK